MFGTLYGEVRIESYNNDFRFRVYDPQLNQTIQSQWACDKRELEIEYRMWVMERWQVWQKGYCRLDTYGLNEVYVIEPPVPVTPDQGDPDYQPVNDLMRKLEKIEITERVDMYPETDPVKRVLVSALVAPFGDCYAFEISAYSVKDVSPNELKRIIAKRIYSQFGKLGRTVRQSTDLTEEDE